MTTAAQPTNLITDIELCSNRKVGIIFDEYEANGKFDTQTQSPIFSTLPREIRDIIWEYALAPFEDQTHPFAATEYYYRPGHTARLKTDTALLRTCRRIWLEANAMAMLQAEHSFYYHRAAPEARTPDWMAKLTDHNRLNFGHLHLYVQMFAIEGLNARPGRLRHYFLHTEPKPGDFQPRMLHVTLRHTDWWFWESETPLRLKDSWVQAMLDSPDLRSTQTFKLELETLDYKVSQLKPILDRLRKMESKEFETHIIDGKPVTTKFVLSPIEEEYTWAGPTNIDGTNYDPYAGMTGLKYHVTTLTWHLKFPPIPAAFIPQMRRAPRVPLDSDNLYHSHHTQDLPHSRPTTDLPYFDRSSHAHAKKFWRKKNRGKGVTDGDADFVQSHRVSKAVHRVMRVQAEDVESHRRRRFVALTADLLPAKWEEQKSLLRFLPREGEEPAEGEEEELAKDEEQTNLLAKELEAQCDRAFNL